jgi:hypothetical protein
MPMMCIECGDGPWVCGRSCINDPKKRNGLLFKKDGTEKTLWERGLTAGNPELPGVKIKRRRREEVVSQLKVVTGGYAAEGVTPPVTKRDARRNARRKKKRNAPVVRVKPEEVRSASAERQRRYRERKRLKEEKG